MKYLNIFKQVLDLKNVTLRGSHKARQTINGLFIGP